MTDVLRDEDIAESYVLTGNGLVTIESVERWLKERGLGHRNAMTITRAVDYIQDDRKPAPVRQPLPTPEQVAFEQNQMNGYGDAPEVQRQLAGFVAGLE